MYADRYSTGKLGMHWILSAENVATRGMWRLFRCQISKFIYFTQFNVSSPCVHNLICHPSLQVVYEGGFLGEQYFIFFLPLDVTISYWPLLWQSAEQSDRVIIDVPVCPSVHPPCRVRECRPLPGAVKRSPRGSSWWHHTADTSCLVATRSCHSNTGCVTPSCFFSIYTLKVVM